MNQSLRVGGREPARDLDAVLDRLAHGQRARREPLAQRLALEQLHDDEQLAVVDARVEDADDVRMRERGDGLRFALEPRPPIGVGGERGRQDLDRHVTLEPRVPGAIDLAHSAFANRREDFVGAQTGGGGERHRARL